MSTKSNGASPQKKHPGGRPPKKPEERRVMLPPQRVAPETLRKLQAAAPQHGGIGRLLDHLAAGL